MTQVYTSEMVHDPLATTDAFVLRQEAPYPALLLQQKQVSKADLSSDRSAMALDDGIAFVKLDDCLTSFVPNSNRHFGCSPDEAATVSLLQDQGTSAPEASSSPVRSVRSQPQSSAKEKFLQSLSKAEDASYTVHQQQLQLMQQMQLQQFWAMNQNIIQQMQLSAFQQQQQRASSQQSWQAAAHGDAACRGYAKKGDTSDLSALVDALHEDSVANADKMLQLTCEHLSTATADDIAAALHLSARRANPNRLQELGSSADMLAILKQLRSLSSTFTNGHALARFAWALGKFDAHSEDAEALVSHLCDCPLNSFSRSTSQDLTNMVWGLARLHPSAGTSHQPVGVAVANFAAQVLTLCAQRVDKLTPQCISNSLWATARLRITGSSACNFVHLCVNELYGKNDLASFTSQGVSNAVWALAEIHGRGNLIHQPAVVQVLEVCERFAAVAQADVVSFQPQELSMLAWGLAKLFGRPPRNGVNVGKGKGRTNQRKSKMESVDVALVALANEARSRLLDLSAQSISNISWALATRDLLSSSDARHEPARRFLEEACRVAQKELSTYAPQAIANILWAVVRLGDGRNGRSQSESTIHAYSVACAQHATLRMLEFSWRDLAGVAVAFAQCHCTASEVNTFMTLLVGHVAVRCHELNSQAMLNIAQSAARLCTEQQAMQPMVDAIAATIKKRALRLNEVDKRQWDEAQAWCPVSVASFAAGSGTYDTR